ncbi:autotransporter assembly complex protein TamA [Celeribacter indicus]|uniref:Surface antigen (D15) n=1 Tax=Celeribacter indicus TaxID=1208324 RepID=A0A0B5DXZ0_9RHOB|nr:autotransporter assembly complex family protein [Celeribacter indicus]AJE48303.1 surface antigen (D15) [Celeribacter indicus]SDW72243.1 autotransporter secretion outer membrane protein TamA [Celeribacter indicus]
MLKRTILAAAWILSTGSAQAFEAQLDTTANDDLRDALEAISAVMEAADNDEATTDEIFAAVQSDYRALLGVLYRNGYYAPEISIRVDGREGADIPLISLPPSVNRVDIAVAPGPRFRFRETTVAPLAPGTELPEDFAPGEVAKSALIGEAKNVAIDAWRQASHAKAELAGQSIVANHPQRRVDVELTIDPGPALRFGHMQFRGDTTVREDRLLRIANLPSGSAFDPDALDLVTRRLQNTGTFRSITLREAETVNPDGTIDIIATLTDEKRRRFGFGAEISSLEGGTLTAYWMHRNLTNNADRLRFDAAISGIGGTTGTDYSIGTTYRRPATVSRKTTLVIAAEIAHLDEPDYTSDTGEFTVGAEVETSPNSRFSFGVGYRYSQVDDALGDREFNHVILPMEGARDTRDDKLNPKSGTYVEAEIMPFIGVSGSETGARLFGDGRGYFSFGADDRFTLAGRLQLGSVTGADYTEVPPDLLFYSGGGGTVRGQPYQSLHVELGDDEGTGGSSFVGVSAELRAKLRGAFSLVGFYDIGGIGTTALPGEQAEWHSGAGLGLRYDTGFGPIRVDVAGPVTGDTGEGVQLYIGIGQAF